MSTTSEHAAATGTTLDKRNRRLLHFYSVLVKQPEQFFEVGIAFAVDVF